MTSPQMDIATLALSIISICAPFVVMLMAYLVKSIHDLNVKMAVVIEKYGGLDGRVTALEERN